MAMAICDLRDWMFPLRQSPRSIDNAVRLKPDSNTRQAFLNII